MTGNLNVQDIEELWKKAETKKDRLSAKAAHNALKDFYTAHKLKYKKEAVDALIAKVDASSQGQLEQSQFSELVVLGMRDQLWTVCWQSEFVMPRSWVWQRVWEVPKLSLHLPRRGRRLRTRFVFLFLLSDFANSFLVIFRFWRFQDLKGSKEEDGKDSNSKDKKEGKIDSRDAPIPKKDSKDKNDGTTAGKSDTKRTESKKTEPKKTEGKSPSDNRRDEKEKDKKSSTHKKGGYQKKSNRHHKKDLGDADQDESFIPEMIDSVGSLVDAGFYNEFEDDFNDGDLN